MIFKIIVAFQIYQSPGSQKKSECQSYVYLRKMMEIHDGPEMGDEGGDFPFSPAKVGSSLISHQL